MADLVVAPVVEGRGEVEAVRGLLTRVWQELLGGTGVYVLNPIRVRRDRFLSQKFDDLDRYVSLAAKQLSQVGGPGRKVVVVLIDAEGDCAPGNPIGKRLLERVRAARPDVDAFVVVADPMYETWFAAGAEGLGQYLDVHPEELPENPDKAGTGASWVRDRMKNGLYAKTIDQPRLTSAFDLKRARDRSRSFRHLCSELEKRLVTGSA